MPATTEMLVVCLVSFCFSAILYPAYISWLKKKQVEQYLREDGPESHAHKARTPTIGGVVFALAATLVTIAAWFIFSPGINVVDGAILLVGVLCCAIGFVDDFSKFTRKNNRGISGYIRLGSELFLGAALGALFFVASRAELFLPFCDAIVPILGGAASTSSLSGLSVWVPPWPIYVALSAFLVAATANSINLHDGMDGLAAGTSCQVFASLALMLLATGQIGYALVAACAAGALCGFLLFNRNPAQIFMGDTGSLFIGGLMGSIVVASGLVVWFVPLALVYILEALSVLIQVICFKLTKRLEGEEKMPLFKVVLIKLTKRLPGEGKRVFRMAPLHHHYEAVFADKGVPEWQVVMGFWLVQFVLCVATLGLFFAVRS